MPSMPHSVVPGQRHMPGDVIVGVDTHRDTHTAVVIDLQGVLLGHRQFPTTSTGYRELASWSGSFGTIAAAGIEATATYGAALTRHLHVCGIKVIEVSHPDKADRRRRGKTDLIDAEMAARAVLSGRAAAIAKTTDGPVEMLRIYKNARTSALKARTQAINQLKAIIVRTEPQLREQLAGLTPVKLIHACLALDGTTATTPADAAAYTLRLLAQRIQHLTQEINDLRSRINTIIQSHYPELLEHDGVGPDNAATLLITAGDNPQRLRNEASFAALCGTSPVQASSGMNNRYRLNRGGDRQANRALHMIILNRIRYNEQAKSYMNRRLAEGKTRREIFRCLKRFAAREIYKLIAHPQPLDA